MRSGTPGLGAATDFPGRDAAAFAVHEQAWIVEFREAQKPTLLDVSYQSEPLLGFRAPIGMRERYRTADERVEGIATYGRFRQFQVTTGATLAKPAGGR